MVIAAGFTCGVSFMLPADENAISLMFTLNCSDKTFHFRLFEVGNNISIENRGIEVER